MSCDEKNGMCEKREKTYIQGFVAGVQTLSMMLEDKVDCEYVNSVAELLIGNKDSE